MCVCVHVCVYMCVYTCVCVCVCVCVCTCVCVCACVCVCVCVRACVCVCVSGFSRLIIYEHANFAMKAIANAYTLIIDILSVSVMVMVVTL